ncbi:glutaredoxin family protein [Dethiosulfovibrio salsuginis]|uniref:Glutaredoxin-like protein, YruB-family n=1 Tax=Dethiosulfovibrio salsuginis TaxID=561720 RepID=A0A1X7LBB1_9BACT|nr:glutaredoxin domain-containing protein [Dethiosulfovibrio salsuginis]SMG51045.1 Glutaredoxin-like protein, YruB-family [Dethiosulfovibrio salsuginis]
MTVKVYSTQGCVWCKKVKEYLTDKGVQFDVIDVGADREAAKKMVAETGQMGVPVIDVDGKYIVGFDKAALDEALGL